jgi:hypothetical protein
MGLRQGWRLHGGALTRQAGHVLPAGVPQRADEEDDAAGLTRGFDRFRFGGLASLAPRVRLGD